MNRQGITKKISFFALAIFFTLASSSSALSQVAIVGYDTSTQPGGTNNFGASPLPATVTAANVTVSGLTRGVGVGTIGTGAARGFGGNDFLTGNAAASITGNKFFTFTVQPNAGFSLSLSSINPFSYRRSSLGATSATVQYQINSDPFVDITTLALTSSASTGATLPIDLSGIAALQGVSSTSIVTFRIVPFGGTAPAGTFYIFDVANSTAADLALNGTVSSPTASAVLIAGRVLIPQMLAMRSASVTLTDAAGNSQTIVTRKGGGYRFNDVVAGETYVLTVSARGFTFAPQIVTANEDLTEVNFAPQQ